MNSLFPGITFDFSPEAFEELISALRRRGFSFGNFHEVSSPDQPVIILRHDVDIDLGAALLLAEHEQTLGVKATYFILCSSDLYNPSSAASKSTIQSIIAMGHEVGLHFDPTVYSSSSEEDLAQHLQVERLALERITDLPVKVFSLHRPGVNTGALSDVDGLVNAYSDRYFKEIAYVSDSMGWWRFGHPLEQDFFRDARKAQLVLHPIWWTSNPREHPADRLKRYEEARIKSIRGELARTVSPYADKSEKDESTRWVWAEGVRDDRRPDN